MKILLVNDDGIDALGLWVMARRLLDNGHEVVVVAPWQQQSCTSHAVTLHGALSYTEVPDRPCRAYSLQGSPCDCVKFALLQLVDGVDCVISGINEACNIGSDVLYSGTVNAALEGAYSGVRSIAISANVQEDDYALAADFVVNNLATLLAMQDDRTIVSVNVPFSDRNRIAGVAITTCGRREFDDFYELRSDGYHLGGQPRVLPIEAGTDIEAIAAGYISITPIRFTLHDEALALAWQAYKGDLCW